MFAPFQWLFCLTVLLFASIGNSFAQTPFDHFDQNGDHFLSLREFKGPPKAFKRHDKNGDGKISFEEAEGTKLTTPRGKPTSRPVTSSPTKKRSLTFIDTHNHIIASSKRGKNPQYDFGPAQEAIKSMDANGIKLNLIMPMPQGVEQEHRLYVDDLIPVLKKYPGRFALLGGGDNLNVLIQKAVKGGKVTEAMLKQFDSDAANHVKKGVVGFGEMTAEHVSMKSDHPYVSAPPDHLLFLRLADLAAKYRIPIDLHMESIPQDMPLPPNLDQSRNPKILKANILAFERLLRHNPKANIIWVHMGWDNTGKRSVEQAKTLLGKHPNLFISLRVASGMQAKGIVKDTFPLDGNGKLKHEWLALFREFPDRFVLGSDEIFIKTNKHPSSGSIQSTFGLLNQLPEDLQKKIGSENARRLYHLN